MVAVAGLDLNRGIERIILLTEQRVDLTLRNLTDAR